MNQIAKELTSIDRPDSPATVLEVTQGIAPHTLAHLNLGLFRYLRKLGTSRERICAALGLSHSDYEYICRL